MEGTKLAFLKGGSSKMLFSLCLFFIIFSFLSGCYKKKDTVLQVIVKNETGSVVNGAQVHVFGEPTVDEQNAMIVSEIEYTSNLGVATFTMNKFYKPGQTGVAVLKIEAQNLGKFGSNYVTVIEEETVTQTVILE
jgi:hypothetical protein